MERFGAKLRQLREDRGMTQKEFASLFEVNRATIGHYESNISYPSADVLVKMANYFHITVDQLLGRTTADPNLFTKKQQYPSRAISGCGKGCCCLFLEKN